MKKIKQYITARAGQYEKSPFIQFLKNRAIPPQKRLSYLPYAVYFIMTFADINRLLLPKEADDNPLQTMINTHGQEDGKHWAWFLHDLNAMGYNQTLSFSEAIKLIWSDDAVQARRYCYTLIKHCSQPQPLVKLVIIEALEAMGKEWLDSSVAVAREMELSEKLVYLGQHHSDHEVGHAIGTEEDEIDDIILPDALRQTAETIVDELFDGIEEFYKELLQRVQAQDHNQYLHDRHGVTVGVLRESNHEGV